jgi:hypothetical protein
MEVGARQTGDVTALLQQIRAGDSDAANKLMPLGSKGAAYTGTTTVAWRTARAYPATHGARE